MKGWGGLVVGWDGCECDGLVSNTLSLSLSVTSTHPSMVSHSAVCFKAIVLLPLQSVCWCCCVVPLLPLCPISLLIGHCHVIVACTMSCVCVGFVGVCCVMSSDGVWGVDDAVCVSLSTPKKRQHSTRPCLHVMVCTNVSYCIVDGW